MAVWDVVLVGTGSWSACVVGTQASRSVGFLLDMTCLFCVQKGETDGVIVYPWDISKEAFGSWLCLHEQETVGRPGLCFDAPLARWLSEVTGQVYGVDGKLYGRGCWEPWQWQLLPRWAEVFTACSERFFALPLTGEQAFDLLAHVEQELWWLAHRSRMVAVSPAGRQAGI